MFQRSTFSDRLVELRTEKKISQEQLAKELGKSRVTISYYENSERTPDMAGIIELAKFFEVTSDYLLGLSPCKNSQELAMQALADELNVKERYGQFFELSSFYKLLDLLELYLFDEKAMLEGRDNLGTELKSVLDKYPEAEGSFYKKLFAQTEKGFYYEDINKAIFDMRVEIVTKISSVVTPVLENATKQIDEMTGVLKKLADRPNDK